MIRSNNTLSRTLLRSAILAGAVTLACPAIAGPVMEIKRLPGPGLVVAVQLRDIGPTPAAGWQAFLEYDPSRVTFLAGAYVTSTFGLPVINPVTSIGGDKLNLAAGIDPTLAQPPSSANQDVAYLIFNFAGTGCQPRIRIRNTVPPTRLTDMTGASIDPLTTISLWSTCNADINDSGALEIQDVFDFLNLWFAFDCRADFNNINGITIQDIFDFLNAWFAGCP
ncbi:MAG: hypothetical protein K2W85_00295 [Phycisphaerales bacterium]|nr:hypothetical protein [Phycisphaerales bacterium]